MEAWAEHWRRRGFIALHVDSFGPRGQREICTQRNRAVSPERDRPLDAHAALRWLAARPDVDAARIHLQGWSNGGMAVLGSVVEGAPGHVSGGVEFRSAVAFYPGCATWTRRLEYRSRVPLLIQSGAEDDWTPAVHCEALALKSFGRGAPIEIDVYPGAHHAFDGASATRVRPDVRNAASPTGWGATVGSHPEARARALQRTTDWIDAHNR
jgi:dienelactone hydrolase